MEVSLNKMEMTVSVCRFYDLFFFLFFNHKWFHIFLVFIWTGATRGFHQAMHQEFSENLFTHLPVACLLLSILDVCKSAHTCL